MCGVSNLDLLVSVIFWHEIFPGPPTRVRFCICHCLVSSWGGRLPTAGNTTEWGLGGGGVVVVVSELNLVAFLNCFLLLEIKSEVEIHLNTLISLKSSPESFVLTLYTFLQLSTNTWAHVTRVMSRGTFGNRVKSSFRLTGGGSEGSCSMYRSLYCIVFLVNV